MKPQDIILLIILIVLVLFRKPKWLVWFGLILFAASIPLFAKWLFFTAEHFVWWGALAIFIAAIWMILEKKD